MATAARRDLEKALQSNTFKPVYLLHGEEEFTKEETLRRVVSTAVDSATRDFNLDILRGGEVQPEQLQSVLRTPPLMAQRRVVVIRDIASLKKAARAELDRYLEKPSSDLLVLLVAEATGSGGKADRGGPGNAVTIEFGALDDQEAVDWIRSRARISHDAATLLQQAIGNDLPRLASELEKLASYSRDAEVDEDAVRAIVGIERGKSLGDLLDKIAERDARAALALIEPVLALPKTSGVTIVMALTTQFLAFGWGRAMRDRGTPVGELRRTYYDFLKQSAGAMTGRPWGDAVRTWANTVDRWSTRSIERALDTLLLADITLKETRVSSEEQILSTAVLALCQPADAE